MKGGICDKQGRIGNTSRERLKKKLSLMMRSGRVVWEKQRDLLLKVENEEGGGGSDLDDLLNAEILVLLKGKPGTQRGGDREK